MAVVFYEDRPFTSGCLAPGPDIRTLLSTMDNPSFVLRGIKDTVYEQRPVPSSNIHAYLSAFI